MRGARRTRADPINIRAGCSIGSAATGEIMFRLGLLASIVLAGCVTDGKDGAAGQQGPAGMNGSDGTNGADGSDGAPGPQGPAGPQLAPAAVYTLSNATAANQLAAYTRATDGALSRKGSYMTGGAGLGAGLGSQGALVWDARTQRFFTVNAGDDTISMLALAADGSVTTLSTVGSGGKRPVSIAVFGDTVYVANQLDTFAVQSGVAQPGNFQASAGQQPFAFDFSPEGFLIVAEVGNGTATGSSASSYSISASGALTPITPALPTHQGAACWIVAAGGYAYISNAATANITGLVVSEAGALTLHEASGVTATSGPGSIDVAVTPDNGYLYALAGNPHEVFPFAIASDGSLAAQPALPGVPTASAGLVAR